MQRLIDGTRKLNFRKMSKFIFVNDNNEMEFFFRSLNLTLLIEDFFFHYNIH